MDGGYRVVAEQLDSSRVAQQMTSLQERTAAIRRDIEAIQARTREIDANIVAVSELGKKNYENIDGVNTVVNRFKVAQEADEAPDATT